MPLFRIGLNTEELVAVEFYDCGEVSSHKYPEIGRLYRSLTAMTADLNSQPFVAPGGAVAAEMREAALRAVSLALEAARA